MEYFINQAKAFLGVMQSILPKNEQEKALEAADEMYEKLREVVDKRQLSIREMVYASIAIMTNILEIAQKETEKRKEDESK